MVYSPVGQDRVWMVGLARINSSILGHLTSYQRQVAPTEQPLLWVEAYARNGVIVRTKAITGAGKTLYGILLAVH